MWGLPCPTPAVLRLCPGPAWWSPRAPFLGSVCGCVALCPADAGGRAQLRVTTCAQPAAPVTRVRASPSHCGAVAGPHPGRWGCQRSLSPARFTHAPGPFGTGSPAFVSTLAFSFSSFSARPPPLHVPHTVPSFLCFLPHHPPPPNGPSESRPRKQLAPRLLQGSLLPSG